MRENQALQKYKEVYSKYVETRVKLHNYHVVFVENLGRDSTIGVRKMLASLPRLERQLKMLANAAYNEQRVINREERKVRKTAIRTKKTKDVDISK